MWVFFFKGIWGHSQQLINVINVFSPCGLDDKHRLWGDILSLKRRVGDGIWCVLGDFNAIRCLEE